MAIEGMHTDLFQHLVFVAFRHDGDEVKVQLGIEFQREIACSISKRWVYRQVVFLLRLVGLSPARLVAERLQLVKGQVAVGEVFGCTAPVSVGESWLHQSTNPSLPRQPSALGAGPHQKQGWWLDWGGGSGLAAEKPNFCWPGTAFSNPEVSAGSCADIVGSGCQSCQSTDIHCTIHCAKLRTPPALGCCLQGTVAPSRL